MGDFSATAAAMSGFRFIRRHPKTILSWALAYVVLFVAVLVVVGLIAGAAFLSVYANRAELETNPGLLFANPALWVGLVLFALAAIAGGAVIYAAAFRAFLRPEEGGFGYFRFGADEVRLAGLYVIVYAASLAVNFAIAPLVALLRGQVALAGLIVVAMVLLTIWASIRLSLVFAATFDQRRIAIASAWRLTRGKFWPIVGAYLLTGLLVWAAAMAVALVVGGVVVGLFASLGGMSDFSGAGLMTVGFIILAVVLYLVAYPIALACMMAIFTGPSCTIYRGLMGDKEATSEVFA